MSTYEISKSSLLSLKAEILRKQEELHKAKVENDIKIKTIKKTTPLEIKNKGVDQRQLNDLTEEEEDLLSKSRSALEAKAKLYDKLSKSSTKLTEDEIEFNKRYLVRFDKKKKKSRVSDLPPSDSEDDVDRYPDSDEDRHHSDEYETPKNLNEEWVEYVDCLGRTRKCLRKDLEHIKANDAELQKTVAEKERNKEPEKLQEKPSKEIVEEKNDDNENNKESELISGDMRRELLRQQWEKEEEMLRDKDNIHYQDILFNEARTHGVGYYGFSKDEEERRKQQEALKKLREETEQQQKKSQELKAMREKQLASRIKAAKDRKRARLGLPPVEEEEPPPQLEPDEETLKKQKDEQAKAKEQEEKERLLEKARRNHLRPWDVGKEGSKKKEHYEYSQEEWVSKKRKERPKEFAPPTNYRKDFRGVEKSYSKESDSNKSLKFSTMKSKKENVDIFETPIRQEPVPIVNECDNYEDDRLLGDYRKIRDSSRRSSDSEDSEEEKRRGKGAEVAPPPTFDYYGPSSSKRTKKSATGSNIEDSIEAGLHFLRKQVEKKESSTKHPREMYLS